MNYGHKGRARALNSTGREKQAAVECVNEKEREGRRERGRVREVSGMRHAACGVLWVALLPTFICIQVFYCMLIKLLLRFAAAVVAAVSASATAVLQCSALFGIHIWSLTNCWRPVAEVITFFSYFLGLVSCRLQNEPRAQCGPKDCESVFYFSELGRQRQRYVARPTLRRCVYALCAALQLNIERLLSLRTHTLSRDHHKSPAAPFVLAKFICQKCVDGVDNLIRAQFAACRLAAAKQLSGWTTCSVSSGCINLPNL